MSRHESLTIEVPLLGKSNLKFRLDRECIVAGTLNKLSLIIRNTGSLRALNVKFTVQALTQAVSVDVQEVEIKLLEANSSTSIPISIYVPRSLLGSRVLLLIDGSYTSVYGFRRKFSSRISASASVAVFLVFSRFSPTFSFIVTPTPLFTPSFSMALTPTPPYCFYKIAIKLIKFDMMIQC